MASYRNQVVLEESSLPGEQLMIKPSVIASDPTDQAAASSTWIQRWSLFIPRILTFLPRELSLSGRPNLNVCAKSQPELADDRTRAALRTLMAWIELGWLHLGEHSLLVLSKEAYVNKPK